MRTPSAGDLLDVWERGWAQPAAQRALLLLAAACPDVPLEALAELSIGQRDGQLLALRRQVFGPQLAGLATCPRCGERLEFSLAVADLSVADEPAAPPDPTDPDQAGPPEPTLALRAAGYQVRLRLLNSLDLLAIANQSEPLAARQQLLERCVLEVRRKGASVDPGQLPDRVVEAVAQRLARADPQADVQLDLSCPACDQRWQVAFDIASFFWNELNIWAQRTLCEVHSLASTYGWREADILAMSPGRRQLYLDLIGE
jgi:hypothetical protein